MATSMLKEDDPKRGREHREIDRQTTVRRKEERREERQKAPDANTATCKEKPFGRRRESPRA
eukprot:1334716-Amorphochlora_amoeboformis.AAC.1